MLFPSNSQDPNDTSKYKIKPLWFSPERFFESDFLSEQKNPVKDLLFFLLTSQEEAT